MGKLQANDKRGHKANLRAASSTDSSLARMPPILLKAGIWIPYFSSSFLILLISSSERTTEKKNQRKAPEVNAGKRYSSSGRWSHFQTICLSLSLHSTGEGIQVGTSKIGRSGGLRGHLGDGCLPHQGNSPDYLGCGGKIRSWWMDHPARDSKLHKRGKGTGQQHTACIHRSLLWWCSFCPDFTTMADWTL